MNRFLWPLLGFLVLIGFLALGLTLKPSEVPSPFIDKPAPGFTLPQLAAPEKTFSPEQMKGQVWLLNIWASWCYACLQEHPVITDLARSVPIVGLNYKDKRDEAIAWLERYGNGYIVSASDTDGRVGINYGVYGVPETFVIDKAGFIRYKHIGAVDEKTARDTLLPLIRELNR
ncbi:DsbE family thiol:disulfide interchange protein [Eoetvoesiella caeni]|uniref:Cytochrome c biogenesis protein CcmG/thiol:disulfide interchange protein DsbE n=1 Tax=Eoetvoesiella caeni TaxID=645616 RepID=A0A366H5P0_9BURK|nr:DsbE family thiol:disulfide interchange protein [Eoetvoesiella caeni]MCI2810700.1 DsbE family thiol:disulfide interchange protein [Eoetvoesiella caeni]NYT55710.1 DsbE family thiol:disulfide interchange protein [Eoetvoesiella caeni]RBP36515.1 cytochrome c biogenesis protein CcmG/thiol:disulfide interchange protein DsbE [Eoetvoesiella caeni]